MCHGAATSSIRARPLNGRSRCQARAVKSCPESSKYRPAAPNGKTMAIRPFTSSPAPMEAQAM